MQIVAAVLALVVLVDVSVLWLTGRDVPDLLAMLLAGVFGFYFGVGRGRNGNGGSHGRGPEDGPPVPPPPPAAPGARVDRLRALREVTQAYEGPVELPRGRSN